MCRMTAGEFFLEGEAEQRGGILRVRLRLCAGDFVIAAWKQDYLLDQAIDQPIGVARFGRRTPGPYPRSAAPTFSSIGAPIGGAE